MKKAIYLFVLGIIVWSRPDGGISYTSGHFQNSQAEADRLKMNGSIPSDWEAVAFDIQLPSKVKRDYWRWDKNSRSIKDDLSLPLIPPGRQ